MKPDEVLITPIPRYVFSLRHQELKLEVGLKELVDNAYDASGQLVRVLFNRRVNSITVEDNGAGCDDPIMMLTYGLRLEHPTSTLGQFAAGLKDTAIALAKAIRITTRRAGQERIVFCHWPSLEGRKEWAIKKPIVRAATAPDGTIIELLQLHKPIPTGEKFQRILESLAEDYYPALQAGAEIQWMCAGDPPWRSLQPSNDPPLEHARTRTLSVQGKEATVTMGIVINPPPGATITKYTGLRWIYGFRVIDKRRREGLGPQSTPGLFGAIVFEKSWALTKNKTAMLDDLDELFVLMEVEFKDVIEQAAQRGLDVPLQKAIDRWRQLLDEIFTKKVHVKAKRHPPTKHTGTVESTGNGPPHQRARDVQPGDRFSIRIAGRHINIDFTALGPQGILYESVGNTIYFNTEHPVMQRAVKQEFVLNMLITNAVAVHLGHEDTAQLSLGTEGSWPDAETLEDKVALWTSYLWQRLLAGPKSSSPSGE